MKIVVSGSNGQLGSKIKNFAQNYYDHVEFIFTDIVELDITNQFEVEKFFKKNLPDVFVNCAAYTAVENAEDDPQSAYNVNSIAPKWIASFCAKYKTKLIHISTDYVFDGEKQTPYIETDYTNPLSVYGKTKLEGEKNILENCSEAIIIRTSWLYSEYGNNFVKTILRLSREKESLKVVNDQTGTPTYAEDLADTILKIVELYYKYNYWVKGIFHYSNEGICTWFDFAKKILELKNISIPIFPVSEKEFITKAQRPKYSVLDKTKIKNTFQLKIPSWDESLKICLNKL